jgi:hypothetical protein
VCSVQGLAQAVVHGGASALAVPGKNLGWRQQARSPHGARTPLTTYAVTDNADFRLLLAFWSLPMS